MDRDPNSHAAMLKVAVTTRLEHSVCPERQPSLRRASRIDGISHPIFVGSWLANFVLVSANAATFIFADWVAWITSSAGTAAGAAVYQEELPGRIIQIGLIAAIVARLFLGQAIDRFGVRHIWIALSLLMLTGSGIFMSLTSMSPLLAAGRICFAVGLSGMFTCSSFHIQSCVTEHRRTEFLGLLGSAGFVGMIVGTQLVDFLKSATAGNPVYFRYTFGAVMLFNVVYVSLAWHITRGFPKPNRGIRPPLLRMMWSYWPGPVVVIAMVLGLMFAVPSVYLVRFNRYAELGGISGFWTAYAISAFLLRVVTVQLSRKVGRYRLISAGLTAQGVGLLSIVPVTQWWHLIASALICGLGHALLFPSIVSLGSGRFPERYRGSGTSLTMGFIDLGTALSAPLLGQIIDLQVFHGVGYRPMFFSAGVTEILVALFWHLWHLKLVDSEVGAELAPQQTGDNDSNQRS